MADMRSDIQTTQPVCPRVRPGECDVMLVVLRLERQRQRGAGRKITQSVRPFDQADRRFKGVIQTKFQGLIRVGEPIKVTVPDIAGVIFVGLNKRKGG